MAHALLTGTATANVAVDIGRGFHEAFLMLWDTLWALLLGFTLSGAVQAFARRPAVRRTLGDHRPGSVLRASLYGMASSSCSYAATATARSLVLRGADFLSAMVFMVASTNLVVELGIVLLVLIGWQFVVAEFVGGAVMIAFVVLLGAFWLRGRVLARPAGPTGSPSDGGDAPGVEERDSSWSPRTLIGWSAAAGFTLGDLRMLVREMLLGFVVAGFLSALVPDTVWTHVFLQGHGVWTSLENVVVGPLIALVSFVCSIGNVPMAAALWRGGSNFGGVVAFVFGDLIAVPLLLIYRRQYGSRTALRMLGTLWVAMSGAGLITEYLFRWLGWIPVDRHGAVVSTSALRWDWTTGLDMAALAGFLGLLWLRHAGRRRGIAHRLATDPVCGMQVEIVQAPAVLEHDGHRWYFCSDGCRSRFSEPSAAGADVVRTDHH